MRESMGRCTGIRHLRGWTASSACAAALLTSALLAGCARPAARADLAGDTTADAPLRRHTFTDAGLDFDPDVSRDGRTIAFASTRHSEHPDLYLQPTTAGEVIQLTADPADDVQPRFSPDGERVVFCSNRSGDWDLWLIGRNGANLRRLTCEPGDEVAPAWSPDGETIAYCVPAAGEYGWEIWILPVNRPELRRFLAHGAFPAWSPDGVSLAFQRGDSRGAKWFTIWTARVFNGEVVWQTEVARDEQASLVHPCWSPDGKGLLCIAQPATSANTGDQGASLAMLRGAGGSGQAASSIMPGSGLAWGNDRRVYFARSVLGTANIWSANILAGSGRADEIPPYLSAVPVGDTGTKEY